mmetsp:Transcript_2638/g.7910  ORF Transcript_2638/g.7910 Transcript_2638/m.7910 type:complete len:202 (+) Transcript_2638:522-1127(+)
MRMSSPTHGFQLVGFKSSSRMLVGTHAQKLGDQCRCRNVGAASHSASRPIAPTVQATVPRKSQGVGTEHVAPDSDLHDVHPRRKGAKDVRHKVRSAPAVASRCASHRQSPRPALSGAGASAPSLTATTRLVGMFRVLRCIGGLAAAICDAQVLCDPGSEGSYLACRGDHRRMVPAARCVGHIASVQHPAYMLRNTCISTVS